MNNIKVKQVEETTLEGYIKLFIYRYSLEKHFFNTTEYILRVQYIEGELVNLSLRMVVAQLGFFHINQGFHRVDNKILNIRSRQCMLS